MSKIEIIKADSRHLSDFGWLKTFWLFSFSSYFAPHNIQLGALRAFNDDIVQPGTGFPTHPHEEMEVALKDTTGRRIFVYLTKGLLSANGNMTASKDQAWIDIDESLIVKTDEQADFILIDVPSCKG